MDHFEVYISEEGLAEIDGEPLVPAPDQSVHEAVLDRLQRHAEERDAPVGATVKDGPGAAHFVLQVLPDGSSHVLAYDADADADTDADADADADAEEAPEAERQPASRPEPGPASEPASEPAYAPASEPAYAPAYDVAPPPSTGPAVTAVTAHGVAAPTTAAAVTAHGVVGPSVTISSATPSVTTPSVTAPGVAAPSITAPAVASPSVTTPSATAPSTTPSVTGPSVTAPCTTPSVTGPSVTAPAVTAPSTGPSLTGPSATAPSVTLPAAPSVAASAIATAVARARATAAARSAAGTAVREPAPGVGLPPGELAQEISRINALATSGRLDEAFADATALRESLTGSVGAEHPHAVEARAVEAYLAHLRGDHREAVVLALAVARIRCGAGDERAPTEVARAAAAWQQLDDSQAAVAHGRELLHMWDVLNRRGPLPPGHVELAEQVHRYVTALEAAYA
ncbi:hypothetical protein [Streptomyces sp. NPDC088350]|uniref:hypothetical protein n=1 Tax=Streptomyces sp. NPDC088350 TaxID=3365854 RepID=UPI00380FB439